MKKAAGTIILLLVLSYAAPFPVHCQEGRLFKDPVVARHDVNKDGTTDVIYYGEGGYVTRAEADTNYDGSPDVIVHIENGAFKTARVDTDYNGTPDKEFSDVAEFNKWLNENNPDFNDKLNKEDWRVDLMKF